MWRLTGLLTCLICMAGVATFAADAVEISQVRVGLDNSTKVSVPTSVSLQLTSPSDFTGEVWFATPDPQGNVANVKASVKLKAGEPQTVEQVVSFGRLSTSLVIEVRKDDGKGEVVGRRRLSSARTDLVDPDFEVSRLDRRYWLSVGTLPVSSLATESVKVESTERASVESLLAAAHRTDMSKAADFPTKPEMLGMLDTLFVVGDMGFSDQQSAALERWVQSGGHLVLSVGARATEFSSSPLANWILTSNRTIKPASVGDLEGLKSFATTQAPIPIVSRVSGSLLSGSDGTVIVPSIDGAIVSRFAHGFGQVTLVGLDLDRKPLNVWRGLDSLLVALAGLKVQEVAGAQNYDRLSRTGITDLASQLHLAVSRFPEVSEHSAYGVLGLILVYLMVVGPLDYFFVHRVLKRPSLTWVSFPFVVLLAVALATFTASAGSSNNLLTLRQTEVLDIDGQTGFVRSTGWLSAYSGTNSRQSVSVAANTKEFNWKNAPKPSLNWSATPEENFGGMYRAAGLEIGKLQYDLLSDHSGISNLPITIRSTQTLRSGFVGTLDGQVISSRLRRAGAGAFDGESSLTHSLPGPIDDWLLVYSGRVYFHSAADAGPDGQPAIFPGKKLLLNATGVRNRELRTFQTGTSYRNRVLKKGEGGDENVHVQLKYDPANFNIHDLLRMISFHEAAGGRSYTGLNHAALQGFELGDLIDLDRAVLLGRIQVPATQVLLGDETQQPPVRETFVRILIPVDDSEFVAGTIPKFKE